MTKHLRKLSVAAPLVLVLGVLAVIVIANTSHKPATEITTEPTGYDSGQTIVVGSVPDAVPTNTKKPAAKTVTSAPSAQPTTSNYSQTYYSGNGTYNPVECMPYLLSAGTALGNAVLSDQQATTSTAEAALGKEEAGVMSSSEENAFMNQVYTKANAAINDLYSLNAQAAKQHGCQTNAGKPILYTLNPVN